MARNLNEHAGRVAGEGVGQWLVSRVGARLCALPLEHVVEIMRPLAIEPLESAPPFVLGLCILRGSPTPVVDVGGLLGEGAGEPTRFVALRVGDRRVALAVDEVRGLRAIDAAATALPPLLRGVAGGLVSSISALDAELMFVLNAARLVPEHALALSNAQEAADVMEAAGGGRDLERFSEAITDRLGLQFEDAKLGFLGEVLQRRADALKLSRPAYLASLESGACIAELAALAGELTVAETYFFRNVEQFRALTDVALPDRMRARADTRTLRILSAACASGEEAYSIAISAQEAMVDTSWNVSVRAVDINPAVLEKAARGRYSAWALRETSAEARKKWFRADGREFVLNDGARTAVDFEQRNLASDDAALWTPAAYDVVFCRNVLMYFSPQQARATIARITDALAPGGYLFLGHAETLRGLSDDFHLHHSHGAFYYQRKTETQPHPAPYAPAQAHSGLGCSVAAPLDEAWVDVIREASERVRALVPDNRSAPAGRSRRRDLGPAFELVRGERFGEALTWVQDAPADRADDPDVLLLEATLLAHRGETAAAETVCRRLLEIDEFNAGAHYVLALCRESRGDFSGAAECDRVATYLDPGFAMPRLHLGLMASRAGDRVAARRELGQALLLLEREEASRILLFGGGFKRDALVALCGSTIRACGGRP